MSSPASQRPPLRQVTAFHECTSPLERVVFVLRLAGFSHQQARFMALRPLGAVDEFCEQVVADKRNLRLQAEHEIAFEAERAGLDLNPQHVSKLIEDALRAGDEIPESLTILIAERSENPSEDALANDASAPVSP